jgi:DNA-binding HxlR family transcriptional regulator
MTATVTSQKARATPPVGSVFDETCSARHALELISGKWAMLIISALWQNPMRNADLLREVGGISQKVLTETLRDLARNGLVIRVDFQAKPLHVEYRLSPLGASLSDALIVLDRWAERNFPELDAARERYDQAHAKADER